MLAPAEVNTTRKTWNFSFPPNIVKWVQDPKSFVFLDITTQERFCSKYSQALWEICIGSLEDQLESYFSVTLDECRLLMCGKDNHQTYKDFKRRVISVALNEINDKSVLHVELYKEIKEGRRVCELVFVVTKQGFVESNLLASDDDLYIKMVDVFGITSNVARLMLEKYDDERISRNLEYTEQQYRKAIKNNREKQFNLGAYATSAITKDYAPKHPQLLTNIVEEKEKKKESEENIIALKQKAGENSMKKVISIFEKIDRTLQMTLKKEFEKIGLRGPVKKLFEQEGWNSDQVMSHFFIFLTAQIEQGRKGQGYDQINNLFKTKSVH
jgi:plasmid replication initiation protein